MSGEHIIVMVVSKQVDGDDTQENDDVGDGDDYDLETLLLQLQCPGCSISATAPIYQCAQVNITTQNNK
jgi:hypothetical protein